MKTRTGASRVSVATIMKGVLLRSVFFTYLKKTFPEHSAHLADLGTWQWYNQHYGISEHGSKASLEEDIAAAEEEQQGCDDVEEPPQATKFASLPPLQVLAKKVARNTFEHCFTSLALAQGQSCALDLAHPTMNVLQQQLVTIQKTYNDDFPNTTVTQSTVVVSSPCKDGADVEETYVVRVNSEIHAEDDYKIRLAEWNNECATIEADSIKAFINTRVMLIVAPKDPPEDLVKRLKQVQLLRENGDG